ncbi:hypothetical protein [Aridibaculum aurantiacum]|uniref:hypothetical protein n=1 Tax=Aridibaculum aurantiacum TaxID=2810307 RepID=UPI001A9605DA|nr:hypothetical protein [Aridibaculum aurantiacum]
MKRSLVLSISFMLLVVLAQPASSQSIRLSNYNGFTGEHDIETSIVTLKNGFTNGFGVSLRSYGHNQYLSFIGYGSNNRAVGENDRLQFVQQDGSIIKFDSRVQLPSNQTPVPNLYIHHYFITRREVEALQKTPVTSVRVVSAYSQTDIPVSKKMAKELVRLSEIFIKELDKF